MPLPRRRPRRSIDWYATIAADQVVNRSVRVNDVDRFQLARLGPPERARGDEDVEILLRAKAPATRRARSVAASSMSLGVWRSGQSSRSSRSSPTCTALAGTNRISATHVTSCSAGQEADGLQRGRRRWSTHNGFPDLPAHRGTTQPNKRLYRREAVERLSDCLEPRRRCCRRGLDALRPEPSPTHERVRRGSRLPTPRCVAPPVDPGACPPTRCPPRRGDIGGDEPNASVIDDLCESVMRFRA